MGDVDEVAARLEAALAGPGRAGVMFGRHRLDTKTPDQIRLMRRAGLVVGETLALMQERTAAGMTTAELDAIAEEHIRAQGATPSFLGYHGFTGSLCVSVNEEVVHGIPGSRRLVEGDLVSIDCGAILQGWHGDAAVSFVVGGRRRGLAGGPGAGRRDRGLHVGRDRRAARGGPAVRRGGRGRGHDRRRGGVPRRGLRHRRGLRRPRHRHRDAPGAAGPELPRARPRARPSGRGSPWRSSRW